MSDLLRVPNDPIDGLLQPTAYSDLFALTSGDLPANPSDLLDSRRMHDILDELGRQADIILIDAPPVLSVTDPITLALQVDGVILVVRANRTKFSVCRQALAQLHQVGANVLGVILTDLGQRASGYYYQGYKYYGHADDTEAAGIREKHRAGKGES